MGLSEDLVSAEVAGYHGGCHQQGSDAEGYLQQHEDEGPPHCIIKQAAAVSPPNGKEPYGKQHEQYVGNAAVYEVYVQLVGDEAVVAEGVGQPHTVDGGPGGCCHRCFEAGHKGTVSELHKEHYNNSECIAVQAAAGGAALIGY